MPGVRTPGEVQAASSLTSPKKKWKKVCVSVCCCVGRVVGRWVLITSTYSGLAYTGWGCISIAPVVLISCSGGSKHPLLYQVFCQ